MSFLRKYAALAWISARSNFAYAGEVGGRLMFLSVILFIFMCVWKAAFANAGQDRFAGYSLDEIIWYLALTECIMMSSPRVTALIDEDVRTGAIAVQLVRPLSYPLYRLASNFGEQTVKFASTALVAVAIAWVLGGPPSNFGTGAMMVLIALPMAFVLDFLGYMLIGLGAFWLEDTTGLMLIYSRLTMIAGGMLMPLDLFPEPVQAILNALPFGYIVCGPARLLVHPDWVSLVSLLWHQLFWVVVMGTAVALVYRLALNRIALNGG